MDFLSLNIWEATPSNEFSSEMAFMAVSVLMLLILVAAAFRFFSYKNRLGRERARQELPKGVSDLFLKVDYSATGPENDRRRGYLRSLTMDRASIVSADRQLEKGATLNLLLDMESPEQNPESMVTGKVVRRKSLGGSPENWLVDIRFTERDEPSSRVIKKYLQQALHRNQ